MQILFKTDNVADNEKHDGDLEENDSDRILKHCISL